MADKYYSLSPYNYVANNPLKYVDIEGMKIGNPESETTKAFKSYMQMSRIGKRMWGKMERVSRTFWFKDQFSNSNLNNAMISSGGLAASLSEPVYSDATSTGEFVTLKERDGLDVHFDERTGKWVKDEDAFSNIYILYTTKTWLMHCQILVIKTLLRIILKQL
jgi:hypothetical protein